jgi:glycosyltransferase involved in cell wall biosynthesis
MTVSVLMPVHAAVAPDHFSQALRSLFEQSRLPEEVVVVVDGPVSDAHWAVLAQYSGVQTLDLAEHVGLGRALAAGLNLCSGDWIARADADDINEAHRFERQLAILSSTGADVCSAAMTEFAGEPARVLGIRSCLVTHEAIARRMRMSNPVNHPTVIFRKSLGLRAGGYTHLPFLEDYDLWARMLSQGARFVGTSEPLVRYRTDGMLARRSPPGIARSERELQSRLYASGLISRPRMLVNRGLRGAFHRLPVWLRGRAYAAIFRRGHNA